MGEGYLGDSEINPPKGYKDGNHGKDKKRQYDSGGTPGRRSGGYSQELSAREKPGHRIFIQTPYLWGSP